MTDIETKAQRVAQALSGSVPAYRSPVIPPDSDVHWEVYQWQCPACGKPQITTSCAYPKDQEIPKETHSTCHCSKCHRVFSLTPIAQENPAQEPE